MNRRKELVQQYMEKKTVAGVYQIKNIRNDKVWIDSTLNVNTINGKRFMLNFGSHPNKQLQEDWKQYGEDSFVIELLEPLKMEDSPYFNAKEALAKLEEKWLELLQPYEDKGYHIKS